MNGSTSAMLAEIKIRAHEIKNPIASIIGSARTLRDAFDRIDPETRGALLDVVVSQAERLNWIISAVSQYGDDDRLPTMFDATDVLGAAADDVGVSLTGVPGATLTLVADERRARFALEALLLALRPADGDTVAVTIREPSALIVRVPSVDLGDPDRVWKLVLARTLLRQEGCSIAIGSNDGLIEAIIDLHGETR